LPSSGDSTLRPPNRLRLFVNGTPRMMRRTLTIRQSLRSGRTKGLEVLGQCSLSLVAKAIQDYLREFVRSEITGTLPKKGKQSWFEFYCHILEHRTSFRWAVSPVPRDQIEQIILSRSDFMHDPAIDDSQPVKGGTHFKKYPQSRFDDPVERAVRAALAQVSGVEPCDSPGTLTVTKQKLIVAIADARKFCEFIATQRMEKV